MKKYISLLLKSSTCLLLISTSTFASTDWTIIVDGSGSMKNFFLAKEIQNYVSDLENKISTAGHSNESKMFIHNPAQGKGLKHEILPFNPNIKKYGQSTDLNILVDDMMKLDTKAIIVVTDNLMDTPSAIGATKEFYARLSSESIKSVYIVPKLFNFRGSKEKKGILVYAILIEQSFINEFKDVKSFFGAEELLLIKPITDQEIILRSIAKGKNNPNAVIDSDGYLRPSRKLVYQMNKKNRVKFNFSLSSNLSHIKISDKSTNGDEVQIGINNLKILTNNHNMSIKKMGEVTPNILQGDLEYQKENSSVYVAKLDFVPTLSWGITDAWSMANFDWNAMEYSKIKMKTTFDIIVDVPPSSFSLSEAFSQKYFTDDRNVRGKIYSDTDILQMINTNRVKIELHVESK